jgi:hypothetical protein
MKDSSIPTIRRAARSLLKATYLLLEILCSRRTWRAVGRITLLGLALTGLGYIAAVTSRTACERHVRQSIATSFSVYRLTPDWVDSKAMRPVPFPTELLDSSVYEREAHSIFRPAVTYKFDPGVEFVGPEPPVQRWGWVKSQVPLPFLVRSYYGFGYSLARSNTHLDGSVYWSRSGSYAGGVLTCVCAFGFAAPFNDWVVGATFD